MPEPSSVDAGRGRRSRLPLAPGPLLGFIVAVLAVIGITYFTDKALEARETGARDVTHTMQVIEHAQQLLTTMANAETGQRGFLLTNDDRYLDPYTQARTAVDGQLRDLTNLTADNPEQRARLQELE